MVRKRISQTERFGLLSTSPRVRAMLTPNMGETEVHIRNAGAGDAVALAALMRALHAHLKEPANRISPEALVRDVLHGASANHVLVAERGGALVGYALFHESYESVTAQRGVYMADLFVAEGARREGLGRALAAAVARAARERGLRFVWWVSEAWDENAQAFYASLGASHDPMIAHAVSFEDFEALADEAEKKSPIT